MSGFYGRHCYWRPTMQPALMAAWDARLFPVVLVMLVHFRLWTVMLTIAVLALGLVLRRKGISIPAAGRLARSRLAGNFRRATSRPPRRAVSWVDECRGGWRWDPSRCRAVPGPRWLLKARQAALKPPDSP